MANNIWYPRYTADYQRKTSHLSILEHGVYTLLLDHYYSTSKPLPTNAIQLHRVCRAFEDDERTAVRSVLAQFFTLEEDGYHNTKADEELLKRCELSTKRKKSAQKRWKSDDTIVYASAIQLNTQSQSQSHIEDSMGCSLVDNFESFWKAYPSRKGSNPRKPALKAFQSAIKRGADPQLLVSLAKTAAPDDKHGTEFVPQAVTWLNQDRWKDAGKPDIQVSQDPELAKWGARVNGWLKNGYWLKDQWGEPPNSAGFSGPQDLRK